MSGEYSCIDSIKEVYDWLCDDISKDIYLKKINYIISNEKRYIDEIVKCYLPNIRVRNGLEIKDLLNSIPNNKSIVLYGVGIDLESHIDEFKKDDRIKVLCDIDANKQRKGAYGYPVISPVQLVSNPNYYVIITSHVASEQISTFLKEHNYPMEYVYELAPYIFHADNNQYFGECFWDYDDNGEVFIDDGCCNLQSTIILKGFCKNLKKVYAFEPDPYNYELCEKVKNENGLDQVELINKGTWKKTGKLSFSASKDGASHITMEGEMSIEVVAIDDVVDESQKVTLIKMDVEGAELESLQGASACIQRDKPKLAICIYHKSEDMYVIPKYIKSLVPEYKFYIRHHSNIGAETVLYAKV